LKENRYGESARKIETWIGKWRKHGIGLEQGNAWVPLSLNRGHLTLNGPAGHFRIEIWRQGRVDSIERQAKSSYLILVGFWGEKMAHLKLGAKSTTKKATAWYFA
jgi:hypothetical protein